MATLTHALLLAAGQGTRLAPLTRVRAKPAVPLGGEPMARRIVRGLARAGVSDVTVNLHHRPESVAAVLGDGADLGAQVRYSWEQPQVLGSAGGPRQALRIIGASPFLIVNGDTLSDVDVARLAQAHHRSGAVVTLALTPNVDPGRYGGVHLADDGAVVRFARRGRDAEGSFHFIGVQVADRRIFEGIGQGAVAHSIGGVYDEWLQRSPGSIRGFVSDVCFRDIGTVSDYWRTSQALRDDAAADWPRTASVAPSAAVHDSILWDDVTIGEHAVVERCIVTDGVRVGDGEVRQDAILRVEHGRVVADPLVLEAR